MTSNVIEALKNERDMALRYGSRYLIWDNTKNAWKVYGQDCGEQQIRTKIITADEVLAIEYLLFHEGI